MLVDPPWPRIALCFFVPLSFQYPSLYWCVHMITRLPMHGLVIPFQSLLLLRNLPFHLRSFLLLHVVHYHPYNTLSAYLYNTVILNQTSRVEPRQIPGMAAGVEVGRGETASAITKPQETPAAALDTNLGVHCGELLEVKRCEFHATVLTLSSAFPWVRFSATVPLKTIGHEN